MCLDASSTSDPFLTGLFRRGVLLHIAIDYRTQLRKVNVLPLFCCCACFWGYLYHVSMSDGATDMVNTHTSANSASFPSLYIQQFEILQEKRTKENRTICIFMCDNHSLLSNSFTALEICKIPFQIKFKWEITHLLTCRPSSTSYCNIKNLLPAYENFYLWGTFNISAATDCFI